MLYCFSELLLLSWNTKVDSIKGIEPVSLYDDVLTSSSLKVSSFEEFKNSKMVFS